ncbi:MAG: Flp pilus assembly complex ATPase component TadA [Eubacterium sp.]|nr:Flp pilus assembly complex ATPase component TadA [Eubacterium sp.]
MPIMRNKKRLGDLLVDAGVINEDQLKEALKKQREMGSRLGQVLIELGMTDEEEVTQAMHTQLGLPIARVREAKIPREVIMTLPENIVRKYNVMPIMFDEANQNILYVAMEDPMNIIAIDDIGIVTNKQIEPMVATPSDINFGIERYYGSERVSEMAGQYAEERRKRQEELRKENEEGNEQVESSPIVILVNKIVDSAANERASDIHIEPMEEMVRVRYRIDGVMQEVGHYEIDLLPAIVARIKIISGLNISEKRVPQDGRMTHIVNKVEYDIRVSTLPTVYGEKVVMRLAEKKALTRDKKDLGFPDDEMKKFNALIAHPNGIILVTGPTGSGKSTTLYTVLSELNHGTVNIITVEDPVEANVDGINQVQTNDKAGLTFASALRSILRQDPDIIMIGEIRDGETAGIAVKASITGHLVVSTLHTNSAASTITRLEDMGVEPYLIADSVIGVIAQRLVRRLCTKCRVPHELNDQDKMRLRIRGDSKPTIYEAGGCAACNQTGYRGRIGVYEIMPVTPALRKIIAAKGNADEIQDVALKEGLTTLRMGAAKLVLQGITTINEVERIATE